MKRALLISFFRVWVLFFYLFFGDDAIVCAFLESLQVFSRVVVGRAAFADRRAQVDSMNAEENESDEKTACGRHRQPQRPADLARRDHVVLVEILGQHDHPHDYGQTRCE